MLELLGIALEASAALPAKDTHAEFRDAFQGFKDKMMRLQKGKQKAPAAMDAEAEAEAPAPADRDEPAAGDEMSIG